MKYETEMQQFYATDYEKSLHVIHVYMQRSRYKDLVFQSSLNFQNPFK